MSEVVVITRLLLIMVLAGLIGVEREYHKKPAGLRTNIVTGLAATLMTIVSVRGLEIFSDVQGFDPTRIVSTVVTGIGFIGAGAILRKGIQGGPGVIGLTTAATLWLVTGIGIAIGMGFYFEALVTTALVFFTFVFGSRAVEVVRIYADKYPPKRIHEHEDHDDD